MDLSGGARINMTKIDNSANKIFYPAQSFFDKWQLFLFEEVDLVDEDLPLGKVNLHDNPGEWILNFEVQVASVWTVVHSELARSLPVTSVFTEYDN